MAPAPAKSCGSGRSDSGSPTLVAEMHIIQIKTFWAHGRRQRGAGRAVAPWIFIHGTDIIDRGLIMLFFRLFYRCHPMEIFLPTPLFRLYVSDR